MKLTALLAVATFAALGTTSAQADHRRNELAYLLGGAIVGAAVGELIYDSRRGRDHYGYRNHGHRYSYNGGYRYDSYRYNRYPSYYGSRHRHSRHKGYSRGYRNDYGHRSQRRYRRHRGH